MIERQDLSALAKIVREYVSSAVLKFVTKEDLEARLKEIPHGPKGDPGEQGASITGPQGKDGIDGQAGRDGIDGKDGAPGVDGKSITTIGERGKDGIDGKDGRDGREGKDGLNGKDGRDGVDGRDALQIDILPAIDVSKSLPRGTFAFGYGGTLRSRCNTSIGKFEPNEWDVVANGILAMTLVKGEDPRDFSITLVMTNGQTQKLDFSIPAPVYQEVYDRNKEYRLGDVVTFDNQAWHSQIDTPIGVPGLSKDWKLMVRKGANGKDGKAGPRGDTGSPGRDGRDLELSAALRWKRDEAMSFRLISYQEVLSHVKPGAIDDTDIISKIELASGIVMRHAKLDAIPDEWLSADSPPVTTVPDVYKVPTFLIFSELYENREASTFNIPEHILQMIPRDPTLR